MKQDRCWQLSWAPTQVCSTRWWKMYLEALNDALEPFPTIFSVVTVQGSQPWAGIDIYWIIHAYAYLYIYKWSNGGPPQYQWRHYEHINFLRYCMYHVDGQTSIVEAMHGSEAPLNAPQVAHSMNDKPARAYHHSWLLGFVMYPLWKLMTGRIRLFKSS